LTHLIEKYLDRIGPRRSTIILLTLLVWICLALAVILYAAGMGAYRTVMITRAAFGGEFREILVASAIWAFLLLSLPLGLAAHRVWKQHRSERWGSEAALDRLEKRLYPDERRIDYTEDTRERLALRSLETMELEILGRRQSTDLTVGERIIALERQIGDRMAGNDDESARQG
jgi:hypothetical protein